MALRLLFSGLLCALLLATPGEAAAAQKVSSVSGAGAPLFESETIQLTEHVIATLNASHAALFDFGNSSSCASKRSTGGCKVFPGDQAWPSNFIWELFNNYLGDALIKTVPLAASCYSSWPEYDLTKCKSVTADWTNSYMQ